MSTRLSPTERADALIDALLTGLKLPTRSRGDVVFAAFERGYLASTQPLRLSPTGHRALRGITAGAITASPAAIAQAQAADRESARRANLSAAERTAEAARDYSPHPATLPPRRGGNNPHRASGFDFIGGRVVQ